MGQISTPAARQALILTATDRLVASNADGGLSPAAAHIVLLGEDAGQNLGPLSYVYVIGAFSLDGGMTEAAFSGSTIYGGQNLSALTNAAPAASPGPVVVIGYNNYPAQVGQVGNVVMIGSGIGAAQPAGFLETSNSVFIGSDVLGRQMSLQANGGNGFSRDVFIGARVLRGQAAFNTPGAGTTCADSVVIGYSAMSEAGFNGGIPGVVSNFNVVVGSQACRDAASQQNSAFQNVVAVGSACIQNIINCTNSVFVGAGITGQPGGGAGGTTSMTLIGHGIVGTSMAGTSANTVLGAFASLSGVGSGNVLIGSQCNSTAQLPNNANNRFLLETGNATLLYGRIEPGAPSGLVVGHSVEGVSRDIPGSNVLKLVNGTYTGGVVTPPQGGGLFYSTGSIVHWVDGAGNDYDLTNGGLGTFTVATLPPAPPAGARAFASDALAPAFAAAVVGGGAVFVPVYFDGAAWLCG